MRSYYHHTLATLLCFFPMISQATTTEIEESSTKNKELYDVESMPSFIGKIEDDEAEVDKAKISMLINAFTVLDSNTLHSEKVNANNSLEPNIDEMPSQRVVVDRDAALFSRVNGQKSSELLLRMEMSGNKKEDLHPESFTSGIDQYEYGQTAYVHSPVSVGEKGRLEAYVPVLPTSDDVSILTTKLTPPEMKYRTTIILWSAEEDVELTHGKNLRMILTKICRFL